VLHVLIMFLPKRLFCCARRHCPCWTCIMRRIRRGEPTCSKGPPTFRRGPPSWRMGSPPSSRRTSTSRSTCCTSSSRQP
jgi:hypothetical protein